MVRLQGNIVESVRIRVSNREIDGRAALTHHRRILGNVLGPAKIDPGVVGKVVVEAEVQKLGDAYDDWYDRSKTDLGHYFPSLYHIVKVVDGSEIEDKKTYIGILRAQLSSPELSLMFHNMVGPGLGKFFPLIVWSELFWNLPVVALPKPEHATLMQNYVAEWWGHPLVLCGSPY